MIDYTRYINQLINASTLQGSQPKINHKIYEFMLLTTVFLCHSKIILCRFYAISFFLGTSQLKFKKQISSAPKGASRWVSLIQKTDFPISGRQSPMMTFYLPFILPYFFQNVDSPWYRRHNISMICLNM